MKYCSLDSEASYTKGSHDIGTYGTHGYVFHSETKHYLVSLWTNDWNYVGRWEDAPLHRLQDCTLVSHNRSYDSMVAARMAPQLLNLPWECSADLAAYCQLPRALKQAAQVGLGVKMDKDVRDKMSGKDPDGMVSEFMTECRTYALKDAEVCFNLWNKFQSNWPEHERQLSRHTTMMGQRGIGIDVEALQRARSSLKLQLHEIQSKVPWFGEQDVKGKDIPLMSPKALGRECQKLGIPAPLSTAKTSPEFDRWLVEYSERAPFVKAMGLLRSCNRTVEIVEAMERRRVGGNLPYNLKYAGAPHTLRFSGDSGLNMQNFPRKPVSFSETHPEVDLRALLVPRPGYVFIGADYAQIEARVLLWLAGDERMLKLLASGMDIYEAHARATMGYKDPRPLKEVDPGMRQISKIRTLGLGFGMGARKFKDFYLTSLGTAITLEQAQSIVTGYRNSNQQIVRLWSKLQQGIQQTSLHERGQAFKMFLPSRRAIHYFNVHEQEGLRGQKVQGGPELWWHGALATENCVQGTARDILAHAILNLENAGIPVVLHVHDEVLCEVPEDRAQEGLEAVKEIMEKLPEWAEGIPLTADARILRCYGK